MFTWWAATGCRGFIALCGFTRCRCWNRDSSARFDHDWNFWRSCWRGRGHLTTAHRSRYRALGSSRRRTLRRLRCQPRRGGSGYRVAAHRFLACTVQRSDNVTASRSLCGCVQTTHAGISRVRLHFVLASHGMQNCIAQCCDLVATLLVKALVLAARIHISRPNGWQQAKARFFNGSKPCLLCFRFSFSACLKIADNFIRFCIELRARFITHRPACIGNGVATQAIKSRA